MNERLPVGVRYCGGCNPRYDRVAAVGQLARMFPGLELAPALPDTAYPAVVVVCGCPARCAGIDGLDAPLVYLTDVWELRPAAQELARHLGGEGLVLWATEGKENA